MRGSPVASHRERQPEELRVEGPLIPLAGYWLRTR